jgi:pimeloyl-ACP methyl ester carboxylesterase
MTAEAAGDVILVHGLWMPGMVMVPLARRLAKRGYRTHVFAYRGRKGSIEAHADQLLRFARERVRGPLYFVGHSMGGLVVLSALDRPDAPKAERVVLMGTPVRGCMSARRLALAAPGRCMLGDSQALWLEGRVTRWKGGPPLGVIAGSRPSFGLGRLLGPLPGVNDGVVRLDETEVNGMTERIVLPVGHTELILPSRVEAHAAHFLAHGSFKR